MGFGIIFYGVIKTMCMAIKKHKTTDPIDKKSEVEASNDPRIDQDVPGFPHHPSSEEDLKKKHEKDVKDVKKKSK